MLLTTFSCGIAVLFALFASAVAAPPAQCAAHQVSGWPKPYPVPSSNKAPVTPSTKPYPVPWSNQASGSPSTQICYTSMLPSKPSTQPQTIWSAWTTPCSSTTTVYVNTTITPSASTSTISSTVTTTSTASATTNTASVTTTTTISTTSSVTTTSTTTTTSTVTSTTASTVPTSAGFLPVASTVPGASSEQSTTKKRRGSDLASRAKLSQKPQPGYSPARSGLASSDEPWTNTGDVVCYQYHEKCSVSTTTSTITNTAPTPTSTVTTTITSTVTTTPGVNTTSTITATSTSSITATITATSTETDTSTSFVYTTTVYAACQTPNQAYYVNNIPVIGGEPDESPAETTVAGVATPYDCCVAAILNPNGAIWGMTLAGATPANTCFVFTASTCAAGQASAPGSVIDVESSASTPRAVNGNANCGQWNGVLDT